MNRFCFLAALVSLAVAPAAQPAADSPSALVLASPDDRVRVAFGGKLHTDARLRRGGPPAGGDARDAFLLRRARIELAVEVDQRFRAVVEPGFGEGDAEIVDGWVEADVGRGLSIRAGRFKAPFGLESLRSSSDLWFAERAFPTALSPRRDLGAMAHGTWAGGRIEAAAGVFNGVPDGASENGEPSDAKDAVARVFATPLDGLGVGLAAAVGAERGGAEEPSLTDYETPAEAAFFRYADGVVADGLRQRVGPQAQVEIGRFGAMGEATWARHRVRGPDGLADLTHRAWQVAGAVVLVGEGGPVSGTGTVEASARVHGLRLDPDAAALAAPATGALRATGWSLALHASPTDDVRLGATVERVAFGDSAFSAETFVALRAAVGF